MALTEDRTFRIFRNTIYMVNEDGIKLITEYFDSFIVSVNINRVINRYVSVTSYAVQCAVGVNRKCIYSFG